MHANLRKENRLMCTLDSGMRSCNIMWGFNTPMQLYYSLRNFWKVFCKDKSYPYFNRIWNTYVQKLQFLFKYIPVVLRTVSAGCYKFPKYHAIFISNTRKNPAVFHTHNQITHSSVISCYRNLTFTLFHVIRNKIDWSGNSPS